MFGFEDTLRVLLSVELLAACKIDEDELADEVALTGQLVLQVYILLTVFASTQVPKEIALERRLASLAAVFSRVQLNHEDCVTARALQILRRLVHLTSV